MYIKILRIIVNIIYIHVNISYFAYKDKGMLMDWAFHFLRAVLGSQQNWEEDTEVSYISCTPTNA